MSLLVKICGITRPEDAQQAVAAGADLIGLNFWRGSKRFVQDQQAREIVAAIPKGVLRVGVFVNAHPLVVSETVDELKLDRAQLHGDEIPATWNWLRPEQIIRKFTTLARHSLPQAQVDRLVDLTQSLDRLKNVNELVDVLAQARPIQPG